MQNEAQVSLPENSIVEISALHKSFQDLQALCDVTATIDAGKLTGLVGPDGAGKTTLLRCLAVWAIRPHKPRQAIMMAITVKTLNTSLNLRSFS